MKTTKILVALMLLMAGFTACKKDKQVEPEKPVPTIQNIEVGLSNNEIGIIGRDFHLNAEILAGDKIETVHIKIQQKPGETYTKVWSHEIIYDQYKDAKNATVHKHFDIPADASEGKYDFLIIVNDQNGTKLEEKRSITIYKAENLPLDPAISLFNVSANGGFFYRNAKFSKPGTKITKSHEFSSQVNLSGIKGDGMMYLLLINKKLNHRPESIEKIDFDKVIVYDVFEHKNIINVGGISNLVYDAATNTRVRDTPRMTLGSLKDNNVPPSDISGIKAWETGDYYYGVVYKNTTYNMTLFQYIEVPIDLD
jgi:hypothetical protein